MRSHRHASPPISCPLSSLVLASILFLWTSGVLALQPVRVRYGYFDTGNAIHAACGRGWLNLAQNATEKSPAYEVECFPQSAGVIVASRLDNAQLDVASLGSPPWAEAVARGVDLHEIYISHYLGSSEGIYVRDTGSIQTPQDLTGTRIGVPFGSTAHVEVAYLIKLFGLQPVELVNLSPTEIVDAWDDTSIDAAACWGTARDHVLANGGKQLISAGVISDWGMPTFDTVAARGAFARKHPRFMRHLVGILSRINDSFRDHLGGNDEQNVARWNINENNTVNFVGSLVDSLMIRGEAAGDPSSEMLSKKREQLDLYDEKTTTEQLMCDYFGGTLGKCSAPSRHVTATVETAEFDLGIKRLSTLGIMNMSSFREADIINPTYLNLSRTGNGVATPLGPYEEVIYVDNDLPGPDVVLRGLEVLDASTGRSPYAANELGRASASDGVTVGDSNCSANTIFDAPSVLNGTFGDGANALPGRSYSDNQTCRWTIPPIDDGLVEVRVQRLRVWSGDFVNIYSGGCSGDEPTSLLAQLSGMYENAELPAALPPFRSSACIVVEFVTDGSQERGYAVNETFGDGFEVFFSRSNVQEGDCNGKQQDSKGLCLCGGKAWGGDCSHTSYCIGTTRVKMRENTIHTLRSSSHVTKEAFSSGDSGVSAFGPEEFPYPNDLNCTYELDLGDFDFSEGDLFAKIELHYDIEDTFDLLKLRSGSGHNSSLYSVLSGQAQNDIFFVPVDKQSRMASLHLGTDDKGRRRGFYAEVSGEFAERNLTCESGRFGSLCESKHCLQQNTFHQSEKGIRVTSQDDSNFIRAMPWAPEGGCMWEMKPPSDFTGKVRLNIANFDLEPYPASAVGDKVIITSDGQDIELFTESCETDEDCDFDAWQTGSCTNGRCDVKQQSQFDVSANVSSTSILLVTDRNDGGQNFSGVDFEVQYVKSCPGLDCTSEGGSCNVDGLCTCKDSFACDCSCEFSEKSRTAVIIICVSLSVVLLLLVIYFAYYRRKENEIIQTQRATIQRTSALLQRKESELKEFRLGESDFGDAVAYVDRLIEESLGKDPSKVQNLRLIKRCLIGKTDSNIHVPDNLSKGNDTFIMSEFAGIHVKQGRRTGLIKSQKSTKFIHGSLRALPEFLNLDSSKQTIISKLLSFSNLSRWDFNIFDVSEVVGNNTLLFVSWAVIFSPHSQFAMAKALKQTNLDLDEFEGYRFDDLILDIDMEILLDYLRAIEQDYNPENPYHNAIHAADVVQTLHSLIQMAGESSFDRTQLFSILVAAVVHDVKHPGINNTFQVNSVSDLALTHNDQAVLENEHASHAFKLMTQGDNLNFLRHVEPSEFAEIRKRIIDSVLHTDMSRHFATVAEIKSHTAGKSWAEIDSSMRWEIFMYMLHLADISNPAKVDPVFKLWTTRCLDEFFAQGDKEQEMGLPISPNCDRNKTKEPDSQIGFINFVVKPAYLVLADIIPGAGKSILPVIESNLAYWENQKRKKETV